jgi:hypothetical protein
MIANYIGAVKINKKIKRIPLKLRKTPRLIIGGNYFVCFGDDYSYPCKLLEIIEEFDSKEVRIEIPIKPMSKKGFINLKGEKVIFGHRNIYYMLMK